MRRCGFCQQGSILVMTMLFLPVVVMALGIVTDLGVLLVARRTAYGVADLAALAAAQEVDLESLSGGIIALKSGAAQAAALEWARTNLASLFPSWPAGYQPQVNVRVYNATPSGPSFHNGNGRRLEYPTVCVSLQVPVSMPFYVGPNRVLMVPAHADASVVPRPGGG